MTLAYVALGSNLDNPRQQVLDAMAALAALPDTRMLLLPLRDVAPGLCLPGLGKVSELLARVDRAGCESLLAP